MLCEVVGMPRRCAFLERDFAFVKRAGRADALAVVRAVTVPKGDEAKGSSALRLRSLRCGLIFAC